MKEYWYFTFEYDYLRGRNFIIQLEGSQEETYKKMSKLFRNIKFNQYSSEKAVGLRHRLVCLDETDLKNETIWRKSLEQLENERNNRMSDTKEKLKPCPFCGGNARVLGCPKDMSWVSCDNCGVDVFFYNHNTCGRATKEETIEQWNNRKCNCKSVTGGQI